jgi:hypothetical protein
MIESLNNLKKEVGLVISKNSYLLLLRWDEVMFLRNCIRHHTDNTRLSMDQRWDDTDRGKQKDLERNQSQWHYVYRKVHVG